MNTHGSKWLPWLVTALALTQLPLYLRHLGRDDLVGGDEGYYANAAGNLRYGASYLANPALEPLGPPGDKPFLYHLALRASQILAGDNERALRAVNVTACFALVAASALLAARLAGAAAGGFAAVLAFGSTALWAPARTVMAEPLLTLLAACGLCLLARRRVGAGAILGAGVLFGLGFLCKLWLVMLPGLPAAACVLAGRDDLPWGWRKALGRAGCFALGFSLGATPQLLLVAFLTPLTLPHWLGVYFGFSLASRFAGQSYADYWIRPFWWYGQVLLQMLAVGLPFLALGLVEALRAPGRRLKWLLWASAAALLFISVPRVKSFYYIMPLFPMLFLALGMGAAAAFRRPAEGVGSRRLPWALALGLMLVFLSQWDAGPWPRKPALLAIQLAVLAGASLPLLRLPRAAARLGVAAAAALALLASDERAFREGSAGYHRTYYRDVAVLCAEALRDPGADPLRDAAAAVPSSMDVLPIQYVGPEWPAVSHYLWRRGVYWTSPEARPTQVDSLLRGDVPVLFLADRTSGALAGGDPTPEIRALLAREGVDLTAWVERRLGCRLRYEVYGNDCLARRMPAGAGGPAKF